MEKDKSNFKLLERLSSELKGSFEIVNFWDADLCAIGILGGSSNNRLVYISTFNQLPDQYYYECEIADSRALIEKGDFQVVQKGQEDFDGLVKVLEHHLYV